MKKYVTRRQRKELREKQRKRIAIALAVIAFICLVGAIFSVVLHNSKKGARMSGLGRKGSLSIVEEDPGSIPDYSGEDYIVLNHGVPCFNSWDLNNITGENFSNLDSMGRCGPAIAMLDRSMMPSGKRGEIGQIKPSGWVQNKYEGIVDAKPPFLYNRSHLIAYALTGQNDNELNLITGTRYMNATTMLPWEEMVMRYLDNTDNHVLYRVTPYFRDNELLARGVEMEAYSVEDAGKSICYHVFIFNVQPGIIIDYATGENWAE